MGKDGLTAIPPSGSFSCSKWSKSGGSSNLGEIWPNTIRCDGSSPCPWEGFTASCYMEMPVVKPNQKRKTAGKVPEGWE